MIAVHFNIILQWILNYVVNIESVLVLVEFIYFTAWKNSLSTCTVSYPEAVVSYSSILDYQGFLFMMPKL